MTHPLTPCTRCGAPTRTISCGPCHGELIQSLLSDPAWLQHRGGTKGDRPGETLEQSLRRELSGLSL